MSADRPQYGEYATPEEQRARAGLPPLGHQPAPASVPPPAAPRAQAAPARRSVNRVDRVITFALLGFGLVNVLTSIGGYTDLGTTLNRTLELLGMDGEFTNFAAARVWGIVAAVALMAGYAGTVWLAFRRLNRGRSSWWVPLLGFVVTMLLVSACVAVPMFGDPAFTQGLVNPPAG
ncbi:DUF6264 family protein [Microbacterium sp.]|uniref:DUF6264 family protein n=1 Tax=Microbacterium sp. TaxID=51671 RepID=UPI0028110B28|nr:DUF6264 family protein [Microbacterium sp.]